MVQNNKEQLIKNLIDDGYLKTPSIIEAFQKIDRADFVPEDIRESAYLNTPLPIGHGQTISQPLVVAFMLELLEPKSGEKILDIGAGSGWAAALLACVVGEDGRVVAIERIPELKMMAEHNIAKYNFIDPVSNGAGKGIAKVILGDGSKGYKDEAPYDKIIAAAALPSRLPAGRQMHEAIPDAWKEQLKIGGRIVAPVGQSIIMIEKNEATKFSQKQYFGFSFVPLVTNK